MKHHYEILLALIVSTKEEEIKELLERLEKIMNAEGATVEQLQRLERKEFSYAHHHQNAALPPQKGTQSSHTAAAVAPSSPSAQ